MVYFLQPAEGGPIKIGTTVRLANRLKQLARESNTELRVLAVIDGGQQEERGLHRRFASLRRFGEWFEPGDDLLGFIVEEGQPWEPPKDEPMPAMAEVEPIAETKPVRLDLSPDLHNLLRRVAADEGMSMAAFAREWFGRLIRDEAERRGIKR